MMNVLGLHEDRKLRAQQFVQMGRELVQYQRGVGAVLRECVLDLQEWLPLGHVRKSAPAKKAAAATAENK